MNQVAQLSEAFSRLRKQAQPTQYYYGCVLSIDPSQDTCKVEVLGVDVEVIVNVRVGRQSLEETLIIYPKINSQILFFAEDEDFAKAYLIAVSNIEEVVLRTAEGFRMRCNEQEFTLHGTAEDLQFNTSGALNCKAEGLHLDAGEKVLRGSAKSLNLTATAGALSCTTQGFSLNAGGKTIDIENGTQNLKSILTDLVSALTSASVVTPAGAGTLAPATLTKLQTLAKNIQTFFNGSTAS